jgi:D-serine deaminase-like pyridoxal phosphate-dependent protein
MKIDQIDTPAVLIDADTLERNLRRMAEYCRSHYLALRPHTKTHKIPEIAKLQLECGATGITVAKLAEAEVMADAGIQDIVVVFPLWGESKWRRLTAQAERIRIAVTMDYLSVHQSAGSGVPRIGRRNGCRMEGRGPRHG